MKIILLALLASGCESWASIGSNGVRAKDGVIEIRLDQKAEAYLYGEKTGIETQPFECGPDDTIVADDPSAVVLRRTGAFKKLTVNATSVTAAVFDIESSRVGEVHLSATCGDVVGGTTIRIVTAFSTTTCTTP